MHFLVRGHCHWLKAPPNQRPARTILYVVCKLPEYDLQAPILEQDSLSQGDFSCDIFRILIVSLMISSMYAFLSSNSLTWRLQHYRSLHRGTTRHSHGQWKCGHDGHLTRRQLSQILLAFPFCILSGNSPSHARGVSASDVPKAVTNFPSKWPFVAEDFDRVDASPDAQFYSVPRLAGHHIDDDAVAALKEYMNRIVVNNSDVHDVLDLCASTESYLPENWNGRRRVAGLGMNDTEMASNKSLSEHAVVDLNLATSSGAKYLLPYKNAEFDFVFCGLSIDYLTHPREVLADVSRVLRPGGIVSIAFSDRLFATKAVAVWTGSGDLDHIDMVANFIHFAGGFENDVKVIDLSPRKNGAISDPLYVVQGRRATE